MILAIREKRLSNQATIKSRLLKRLQKSTQLRYNLARLPFREARASPSKSWERDQADRLAMPPQRRHIVSDAHERTGTGHNGGIEWKTLRLFINLFLHLSLHVLCMKLSLFIRPEVSYDRSSKRAVFALRNCLIKRPAGGGLGFIFLAKSDEMRYKVRNRFGREITEWIALN